MKVLALEFSERVDSVLADASLPFADAAIVCFDDFWALILIKRPFCRNVHDHVIVAGSDRA